MLHLYLWIYFIFTISLKFSTSTINEAPAKVTLRIQISKLNQAPGNESRLKLCVDKRNESCFWMYIGDLQWDGDQYKEISYSFLIDNMAADLTLNFVIEKEKKKIDFPKKSINLTNLSSKKSFEINSFNLESFITLSIDHECENGFYPPRQCTKECYPIDRESDCDGFGNKICKEELLYDAKIDKCVPNNCLKSNIRCHNGKCINNGLTYACTCLQSYYGTFCQFRNTCYPNPCLNGGQCIINKINMSFTCSCSTLFMGNICQTEIKQKCLCPFNMKCVHSNNGGPDSCISDQPLSKKEDSNISIDPINNENIKSRHLESKGDQEWKPISLTTTLITAIGCLMLILCICISLYVFYFTRENKRDTKALNSPSTLYTDLTEKSKGTSFKRSSSLDDNSAYIPSNSHILQILPNNFTMGSSNGYSLNTNSYQDNPPLSLQNFPVYGGYMYQQEYPITPLIFHQNSKKESSCSTTSCGSLTTPPNLPPRLINSETTSFGSLPKHD